MSTTPEMPQAIALPAQLHPYQPDWEIAPIHLPTQVVEQVSPSPDLISQTDLSFKQRAAMRLHGYLESPWRRAGAVSFSVLAAGAGLAACAKAEASAPTPKVRAHYAQTAPTTLTPAEISTINQDLTINTVTANCIEIVGSTGGTIDNFGTEQNPVYGVQPVVGALESVGTDAGQRLWSDALESPLPNPNDAANSLSEIESTICKDPLFGVTLANEFANMDIDGVKVVSLNDWLNSYAFNATPGNTEISTLAAQFLPDLNGTNQNAEQALQANQAYQQLAEKLITMLTKFQENGRGTFPTTLNYQLTDGGLVVVNLPDVSLNPTQYNADAIWFTLTKKTGGCYVQVGFNVGDQRPEQSNVCTITPPTTTAPSHHTNVYVSPTHPHAPVFSSGGGVSPSRTTTTFIGPKQNPHPPVPGGEPTTVPDTDPLGPPYPTTSTTTSTTEAGPTTTTTNASEPTTTAPGGCAPNCGP